MRIPHLSYIAAAGAALLLSGTTYAQETKQLVSVGEKAHCTQQLTSPDGKPLNVIVQAERHSPELMVYFVKTREFPGGVATNGYKFTGLPEEFNYGKELYIISLFGTIIGDNDVMAPAEGNPIFGSPDPKKGFSPEQKKFMEDVAGCIAGKK